MDPTRMYLADGMLPWTPKRLTAWRNEQIGPYCMTESYTSDLMLGRFCTTWPRGWGRRYLSSCTKEYVVLTLVPKP